VDEDPLVALDGLVQRRDVGESEKLGLGDVRLDPGAPPARGDEAGEPDEGARHDTGGRETDEGGDQRGREEGGAVRVAHGPLFRHGLREDEYDHDLEHRRDGDADRAEDLCRDDADQRGGDELAQKDEEQDRGQEGLRVLDQRRSDRAPL